MIPHSKLTSNARNLRNDMTEEEKHLWYDFLKKLPYTINRQKVIGDYIVDFYCSEAKIVIEIDGIQHKQKDHKEKDALRDGELEKMGIKVLRYSNLHIKKNFNFVCENILDNIRSRIE